MFYCGARKTRNLSLKVEEIGKAFESKMRQTSLGINQSRSNRSNVQIILHFNSTFNPLRPLKPIHFCIFFVKVLWWGRTPLTPWSRTCAPSWTSARSTTCSWFSSSSTVPSLETRHQECYFLYTRVKYGIRSSKFIWAPVYSCTHWLRPRNPPPPTAFGLIYEGAIGQSR